MAAAGIMIYHYFSWLNGHYSADTVIGRIGIYGVSIFYILSGLTLYLVYADKMSLTKAGLMDFFKKRILRIFPLLWLSVFFTLALARKIPDLKTLVLNLTGLFGFVKWDAYISDGAWSIGNELVFYAFFPIFLFAIRKSVKLVAFLTVVIFGLFVYFSFFRISNSQSLATQWIDYINPLNQVYLFLGGFLIGYLFKKSHFSNTPLVILLILATAIFVVFPVGGDSVHLVTGFTRVIFSLACLGICFTFFKMKLTLPSFIHRPLAMLGEVSYSLYLLHPLVFTVTGIFLNKFMKGYAPVIQLIIAMIATVIGSYFVYTYIEKFFMKLGRSQKTIDKKLPV